MPVVADFGARCVLTRRGRPSADIGVMDEPTHLHESEFWDRVAEWLLSARAIDPHGLTVEQIEALLRAMQEGQEPY